MIIGNPSKTELLTLHKLGLGISQVIMCVVVFGDLSTGANWCLVFFQVFLVIVCNRAYDRARGME